MTHDSTRRHFLKASLSIVSLSATTPLWAHTTRPAAGIQLYTVQSAMADDPAGTLKKLAEIGYREVETGGQSKHPAQEIRRMMDAAGLRCPSVHVHLEADPLPGFELAHTMGAQFATSSLFIPASIVDPSTGKHKGPNDLIADDFKRMAEAANRVGQAARDAGVQYCYHNHNFEFRDLGAGSYGYEILMSETDPQLVRFELDCGWAVTAGHDPIELLHRHRGRIPMIHVKDFLRGTLTTTTLGGGTSKGAELGRGHIDYVPIIAAARKAGVEHFFSEQEPPYTDATPLEAAEINFRYLHSLL